MQFVSRGLRFFTRPFFKLSYSGSLTFLSMHSEIFPYLVVLIGFENVVILTKSVVATPIDLPVKYRIAQGMLHLLSAIFVVSVSRSLDILDVQTVDLLFLACFFFYKSSYAREI